MIEREYDDGGEDQGGEEDLDTQGAPGERGNADPAAGLEEGLEGDDAAEGGQGGHGGEGAQEGGLTRRERRVQAIANEARSLREEVNRQREEMRQLREAQMQRQQQPDPALLEAQLAAMDPVERMEWRLQQAERSHQQQMINMQVGIANQQDRAKHEALLAARPELKRYDQTVEQIFQQQLANCLPRGVNPPTREMILAYVTGLERLQPNAGKAERQKAAANIQGQRAPAGTSKGNVAAGGGPKANSIEAIRKRIENVTF
jgi:hypothetical protein